MPSSAGESTRHPWSSHMGPVSVGAGSSCCPNQTGGRIIWTACVATSPCPLLCAQGAGAEVALKKTHTEMCWGQECPGQVGHRCLQLQPQGGEASFPRVLLPRPLHCLTPGALKLAPTHLFSCLSLRTPASPFLYPHRVQWTPSSRALRLAHCPLPLVLGPAPCWPTPASPALQCCQGHL